MKMVVYEYECKGEFHTDSGWHYISRAVQNPKPKPKENKKPFWDFKRSLTGGTKSGKIRVL